MKSIFLSNNKTLVLILLTITCVSCSSSAKLFKAARENDDTYFNKMKSISNLNSVNNEGQTALIIACKNNNKDFVERLLTYGADPNIRDKKGNNALHYSVNNENYEISKLILDKHTKQIYNYEGDFPINIIAKKVKGDLNILELLLANGADVNQKSPTTLETPLINALRSKNYVIVDALIERGANLSDKDKNNINTLMIVAKSDKIDLAKQILNTNININEKSTEGMTALHYSMQDGKPGMIDFLIKSGSDLNIKTNKFETILELAIKKGNMDATKILLANNVDVNTNGSDNYTPLMYTIMIGDTALIKLLLTHNANVNKGYSSTSPISLAVYKNSSEIVELLSSHGCELDISTVAGFQPILIAADRDCDSILTDKIFSCEKNFKTAKLKINELKGINIDTLTKQKKEILNSLHKSYDVVKLREIEYAKKVTETAVRNVSSFLLTTAVNTVSYMNPISSGYGLSYYQQNNYDWNSNAFNRSVKRMLKSRLDFIDKSLSWYKY